MKSTVKAGGGGCALLHQGAEEMRIESFFLLERESPEALKSPKIIMFCRRKNNTTKFRTEKNILLICFYFIQTVGIQSLNKFAYMRNKIKQNYFISQKLIT